MTSDPGSFARATIVDRKPQIISQVIEENGYPLEIVQALQMFRDEIAEQPMKPLIESAPDVDGWNTELRRYEGKSWLEVPWYWAEVFFYRKLLEAVRYFQPGPWRGHDPFGSLKRRQEADAWARFAEGWRQLEAAATQLSAAQVFEALLHSALWGNRADLSNFTVRALAQAGLATQAERHNLLIDDTPAVEALLAAGVAQVDFICDNVGLDLMADLALADFLLGRGWAKQVTLHLKNQPFFVSDAMPIDAGLVVDALAAATSPAEQALGRRLQTQGATGRLRFSTDPFWTGFLMFRDMPPSLHAELAQAALVVIKGDVNYRRLLDDRHWPHATRMADVTVYFPVPFVALRTLKGEIMVGLAPGQAEQLAAKDPDWLIDGKRGVIHAVLTKSRGQL
jgi:uncharacterized protein with ATP-grasp and redox domains